MFTRLVRFILDWSESCHGCRPNNRTEVEIAGSVRLWWVRHPTIITGLYGSSISLSYTLPFVQKRLTIGSKGEIPAGRSLYGTLEQPSIQKRASSAAEAARQNTSPVFDPSIHPNCLEYLESVTISTTATRGHCLNVNMGHKKLLAQTTSTDIFLVKTGCCFYSANLQFHSNTFQNSVVQEASFSSCNTQ